MAKSTRLRFSDLRRVYHLIGEIVELGADPDQWRPHLVAKTHAMFNLQMSHAWVTPLPMDPQRGQVGKVAEFGLDEPGNNLWRQFLARGGFTASPCTPAILKNSDRPFTTVRPLLSNDSDWYGSIYFNEFRREVRSDDLIISVLPMPEIGIAHGFGGDRALNSTSMGRREVVCASLIHAELHRRWRRLLRSPSIIEKRLPPRLAQLLTHLRGADSEKQIALKMGLSAHTVHNHVRRLYARFGVSSRIELMLIDRQTRPAGVPHLGVAGL